MPHNLIIIQARLSSTRLPGKVLKPFHQGKHLLSIQWERLQKLGFPMVLATTTNPADNALATWAEENERAVFRGDEQNVLKRFIDCADAYDAKHIVRVCSDNPFLQVEAVPNYFQQLANGVDYISACNAAGLPAIKTHWGLFVEGVSFQALKKAQEMLVNHPEKTFYQEHVTNFIYGHPNDFQVQLEKAPEVIANRQDLRFTVDTPEDFDNMQKLYGFMADAKQDIASLVHMADAHPDILRVMQKGIAEFVK